MPIPGQRPILSRCSLLITLLLAGPAGAQCLRQVPLPSNDLVYDPVTKRIWASVPARAGERGGTVTAIDPESGEIGPSIPVGSEPDKLAIADTGRYFYVALDGSDASVRRVDAVTQTPGPSFALGYGTNFAEDMAVPPGHPESVAVSKSAPRGYSPRHIHVAIYDNGVQRTKVAAGALTIAFSGSASRMYGYGNEVSDFQFVRWNVDETGIVGGDSISLLTGFGHRIQFAGGRIYATNGGVYDPEAGRQVGSIPGGEVRADAALGQVFVLTGGGPTGLLLEAYSTSTFKRLWSLPVAGGSGGSGSLIRWGAEGLAFRAGDQIYLVRLSEATSPQLDALAVGPATLTAGQAATGTVTLSAPAPAGGTTIDMSTSHPDVVSVPATVTVKEGTTAVSFPVTTRAVLASTRVAVTATRCVRTQTAILTVQPSSPTPPSSPPPGSAVNLLANGSFEAPDTSLSPYLWGYLYGPAPDPHYPGIMGPDIPGWRITTGGIAVQNGEWRAIDGSQSVDLGGTGTIEQSFATQPGRDYLFSGYITHNPSISLGRVDVFLSGTFFVQLAHTAHSSGSDPQWNFFGYRFRAAASTTTLTIRDVTGLYAQKGTALDGLAVTLLNLPTAGPAAPAAPADQGGG
jgi:hypothetical protein